MSSQPTITRFAPSPTGMLHLGNVRTALLNWLLARQAGGRFLLRFEDTDAERSQQQFIDAICEDLQWLGLNWDGDILLQSSHAEAHRQALAQLATAGKAYRCFCSEHQLQMDRKLASSRGLPPRYSGRCRTLDTETATQRAEGGEPFVWRLAIHANAGEIIVPDRLRGDICFAYKDMDDPVVVRSDGSFTFLLPNAIDDTVDGITLVLRGDDHLTNSVWQVWLLQQLGHSVPHYLHHGLLLDAEGHKLSKRSGAFAVRDLRAQGLFPDAVIQAMARLGHPNMPEEATNLAQLPAHFEAERLSTSAVRWSDDMMWRWHTKQLHTMPASELAPLIQPHLPKTEVLHLEAVAELIAPNLSRAEDAAAFARLLDVKTTLAADDQAIIDEAGKEFFSQALSLWQQADIKDWRSWIKAVQQQTGHKGKALYMPLRLLLSGTSHGPDMGAIIAFLGHQGVTERFESSLAHPHSR
ncbi:MAG: glutamate--tRNA ligase [Mariprofundales bacterium]|nr:glutamate--tRNA ligase [Mariprofundales bacterium]